MKSHLNSFVDLMRRIGRDCPEFRPFLDTPVQQFLLLEDISHETIDDQLFEKCRLYLKDMDSLTDDYDFVEAKYKFKAYEAKKISKARGIQEAEQLYLEVINAARILAEKHQTENAWQLVADCYGALYDGYKKVRKGAQASGYIQKALEELDYAIEHSATTVELRETQCQMYGLLANDFKDKSDVKSVSAAADLYILQINRYLNLRQETGDDSYVQMINKAYTDLQGFLSVQEVYIKLAQKSGNVPIDTIRSYIIIIIHVYSSVPDLPESPEKLEYYRALLNGFGNQ